MQYHFKITKEDDGYWAQCVELPGCITEADSMDELKPAMREALSLFLDEPAESVVYFPLPDNSLSGKDVEKVSVDAEIAMPVLVRHYRHQKGLNLEQAKNPLGLKHRTAYARLEQRGNPTSPQDSNDQAGLARLSSGAMFLTKYLI